MAKQVDLKDVDVYYGDFLAVEDVTLTIPPRAVTAFIGPSGCGRSTVLRTINRLHEVLPGARVEGHGRACSALDPVHAGDRGPHRETREG